MELLRSQEQQQQQQQVLRFMQEQATTHPILQQPLLLVQAPLPKQLQLKVRSCVAQMQQQAI
jgi:hypothetical protein